MDFVLEVLLAELLNIGIAWINEIITSLPPETGLVDALNQALDSKALAWIGWYFQVANGLVPVSAILAAVFYNQSAGYIASGVRTSSWLFDKLRANLPTWRS